jgi:hypothetical protein
MGLAPSLQNAKIFFVLLSGLAYSRDVKSGISPVILYPPM